MKLDITSLLSGRKKSLGFSYEISPASQNYPLPPEGVSLLSDIRVNGEIARTGSFLMLRLTGELDYKTRCDRCAAEINDTVKIDYERIILGDGEIFTDGSAAKRNAGYNSSDDSNDDDGGNNYITPDNGRIDTDADVVEEIMLSFPSQILCSPDCRGICPVCGQNKNVGDCSCAENKEPDPRWAKLLSYLDDKTEK